MIGLWCLDALGKKWATKFPSFCWNLGRAAARVLNDYWAFTETVPIFTKPCGWCLLESQCYAAQYSAAKT